MTYDVDITCLEQQALFDIRTVMPVIDDCLLKIGIKEPIKNNRLILMDDLVALKLGPRRILIKSVLDNEFQIAESLNSFLEDVTGVSIVNVSDMYLGIQLAGRHANEVLAHATPFNLHNLPSGSGTATAVFSLSGIVIHESDSCYSIYVDRSYFDYVWGRINTCGLKLTPAEFG